MKVIDTKIEGLKIIEPAVFADSRGFFLENYNEKRYHDAGIAQKFIQDNMSASTYGVVRGLHFQRGEAAQAKLVQVIVGKVLDVAVDIRPNSKTYGEWVAVELSDENHRQFLIPRGFAHGFSVLSEKAIFSYKCDNLYCKEAEGGFLYNSPKLSIDWQVPVDKMIISDKDLNWQPFE